MRKPRLTVQECRWFDKVHQHVMRYNARGLGLVQSFSDVFDGDLLESEVIPLIRKRLLQRIPVSEHRGQHGSLLSSHFHVDLTPLAIRTFWPDRAEGAT